MAFSVFVGLTLAILLMLLLLLDQSAGQGLPDEPENDRPPNLVYYNLENTTRGSAFQQNLEAVIEFFRENNPPNGYATCLGFGNPPNTVYGHSACYNMSTQSSCFLCIQQTYDTIQRMFPLTVGATYWINSSASRCRLRYETYSLVPNLALLGVIGPNTSTSPEPAPVPSSLVQPGVPAPSPSNGRSRALLWGLVGGGAGLAFLLIAGCFMWRSRMYTKLDRKQHVPQGPRDLEGSFEGPIVFSYQDLLVATGNFSEKHILGRGGFGTVYKATLKDGGEVAVKKLSLQSKQGRKEFVNEINIITSIRHRNLVTLKGHCVEKNERILVYEFLNNGSLDQALFGSETNVLDWKSRFQIAIGIARGLAYLHEESQVQIIHRDIKASNILLDDKLHPKISDFGISKLYKDNHFTSTKVAGTVGYMAPEYATRGRLTRKADVFSYGILILEIASGRKCVDPTLSRQEEFLLEWIRKLYQDGRMADCIDRKLGNDYVESEAFRLIHVALLCTQNEEEARPMMSHAMAMLLGYVDVGRLQNLPRLSFGLSTSTSESITQVTAR